MAYVYTQNGTSDITSGAGAGRVGIGTTTPATALNVKGDPIANSDGFTGQLKLEPISDSKEAAINLKTTFGTSDRMWALVAGGAGADSTNLRVYDCTVGADRINVDSSGKVAIGSTAPGSKLTVTGSGNTSATSSLNIMDSAGNSSLFVEDDGRVGIGTSSPFNDLHIRKSAAVSLRLESATGASASVFFQGGSFFAAYSDPAGFHIDNGGGPIFFIPAGGSTVGIGTTSPGSSIQVNGNAVIGYATSVAGPSNGLAVGGYVGLGTTSPVSRLEIAGSVGLKTTTVTGNYTAADEAVILVNTASATITIPAAVYVTGRVYYIKKTSASSGTVTITDAGGATIDNASSQTLTGTTYPSMRVVSDGLKWWILDRKS